MEAEVEEIINSKIVEVGGRIRLVQESKIPLEERLEKLPGLIYEKERRLYDYSSNLSEMKQQREVIERKVISGIALETTGEGKKQYPNEDSRKAELQRRLAQNDKWRTIKDREADKHNRLELARIDLNFLKNLYSSTKWLVKLKGTSESEEGSQ